MVARLPKRLKSTFFEIFSNGASPLESLHLNFFQKTLILAFEANSALSRENETKIMKITHGGFAPRACGSYFSISKNNFLNWYITLLQSCIGVTMYSNSTTNQFRLIKVQKRFSKVV